MELGIGFSSEELGPNEIVRAAALAEEVGFTTAWVSDHYHPWIDAQGESPFVWSVLGGIASTTEDLRVGTGVTCPTMRIHPAILAQATATAQCMFEGRFWFGVGSGEALNEHILGQKWPEASIRLAMLEEAVAVIRALWNGRAVQPLRRLLHRRERALVHDAVGTAADHRVGVRREIGRRWRPGSATGW